MPIADCVQEFKVARNMLLAHLFVYSLGIVIMTNAQTCYYPDGSVVARDTPCHSPSIGDGASACCDSGDICLDNNLCLSQGGAELISRGSCTDHTWQSPECSQYCSDGEYLFQQPRDILHRHPQYGLITILTLISQLTRAEEQLYTTLVSRTNGCSAVARVTHTTTHVSMPPKEAMQRSPLKPDL